MLETKPPSEEFEPIPLASPDGVIRAWACPRCKRVRIGVSCGGPDGRARETEFCRERAERCCRCGTCGRWLPEPDYFGNCGDCEKCQRERIAALLEEQRAEQERKDAAKELALSTALDRDAALRLFTLMSEISEECYCAGWMQGNEHTLWRMHEGGKREYGMGDVSESDVNELRRLSEKCGGWWRWDEDLGELFVSIEEWRKQAN